jgi:hypothetical protein
MRRTTSTVMAGAALALVACSPSGFNTPTLLNKPRILAIQAEPPQPTLGASTTLRALVYQPPASTDGGTAVSVTYSWSWCPLPMSATDPSQCPIDQVAANELFAGIPGVPPLDLGRARPQPSRIPSRPRCWPRFARRNWTRSLPWPPPQRAWAGSPRNGSLDFGCTIAGFPITVKLVVTVTAVGQPPSEPPATYPAIFNVFLPVNDSVQWRNTNPVLKSGISVTIDGVLDQLDQAGTQGILRNFDTPVSIDMDLSNSEPLPDPNQVLPPPATQDPKDHNNPYLPPNVTDRERLNVYWFAECGDFGSDSQGGPRTGYLGGDPNDPIAPFSAALHNTWNVPTLDGYAGDSARIIVVVHDSRNGVTWTSGVVHLGDTNSGPDGGAPDAPEADSGELAPDAGAPDGEEVTSADAQPETTP